MIMKVKKMIFCKFFISLTGILGCLQISNLQISSCVNFLSNIFESLKDKEFRIEIDRLNFIFTPTLKTGFNFDLDFDFKSFDFEVSLLGLDLKLKLW